MIRSQIAQMVGQVVGYKKSINDQVVPVRLMDSRLWEIHRGPDWHMEVSMEMRPSHKGGVEIGYPVLALYGTHGEFKSQRAELEAWLRETDVTLADLLNEHGERKDFFGKEDFAKGDFPKGEKTKGVLPKGVFFKAISGRQLFADYTSAVAVDKERAKVEKLLAQERWEMAAHAREMAGALNEMLGNMGVASADDRPVVQVQGVGSKRVNIDVDVLMSLVQMGMHMSKECDWCGVNAALLPHDSAAQKGLWLCETCHPRVLV